MQIPLSLAIALAFMAGPALTSPTPQGPQCMRTGEPCAPATPQCCPGYYCNEAEMCTVF
jgi:hypothetical protein